MSTDMKLKLYLERSQYFSNAGGGRGGVTLCQNKCNRQIVMSFLPPVGDCFLKRLTKTRMTGTPGFSPPSYTPGNRDKSENLAQGVITKILRNCERARNENVITGLDGSCFSQMLLLFL